MESSRVLVESSNPFVFAACCAFVDSLAGVHSVAAVCAIRPREPDFALFCVARDEGSFVFCGETVRFRVESSEPLSTDTKPEPFRTLVLSTEADRSVLLELVNVAIVQHRARMTAPRGHPGEGVMRYVWDEDSECWDGGKLVAHRPLSTLFLPEGLGEDVAYDLGCFLKQDTKDKYAALHIAPVRVYLLWGVPGGGKSSLVHCLASETGHNLAVVNFNKGTTDRDVCSAVRNLPAKCFLCIEDVDCLFEQRATKGHNVTFASLLAALDGAYGSSPLTVFMTTNTVNHLDVALRRRVDYAVEFGFATKYQCKRMFEAFHPTHPGFETLWAHAKRKNFSTSVFQKYLVRTLQSGDPLAELGTLDALIRCTYASDVDQESPSTLYV